MTEQSQPAYMELNDVWSYYFHDPNDEDWTLESYIKLGDVSCIDDFWNVHTLLKDHIHMGMFFIMRDYIFPCWDDEHNKDGGCMSIKVLKQDMVKFWEELSMLVLGETILSTEKRGLWNHINGISTSPKKHFCIVKIWLRSDDLADESMFTIPAHMHGTILYKSNKEVININNNKVIGRQNKNHS
jgi:hypothetical protein